MHVAQFTPNPNLNLGGVFSARPFGGSAISGDEAAGPVFHLGKGAGHHGPGGLGKILQHVRQALVAAADDETRAELLTQAREGIAQGVAQARAELEASGRLDEAMEKRLAHMEARLSKGLAHLARHYGLEDKQNDVAGEQLTLSAISLAVVSYEQRSASVQIETREGDIITLEFNRRAGRSQVLDTQFGAGGESASGAKLRYVDQSLRYTLQGDLNEEEQAAIDGLVRDAARVAERFFAGHGAAAFQQALQLALDPEVLSGFSMSLEKTSVKLALGSYHAVAALGEGGVSIPPAEAGEVLAEVGELAQSAQQTPAVADPQVVLPQILEGVAQAKGVDREMIREQLLVVRQLLEVLLVTNATAPDVEEPQVPLTA